MVTCWERTDLLAPVGDVYCVFVTCPFGILGQVWYLIVSITDLCRLSYFCKFSEQMKIIKLNIGPAKQRYSAKVAIIFLSISLNLCFGCSKEPSHRDGSFEYPQHMFLLRNKKIIFSYVLLSGGLLK